MNPEDDFQGWLKAQYGKATLTKVEVHLAREAWDAALIAAANVWQRKMDSGEATRPADALTSIGTRHSWRTDSPAVAAA